MRDLVPDDPRIRYIRLDGPPRTIGVKRNLACTQAEAADVIAHWDDDDWYPSWRLRAQVEAIAAGADVCGSSQFYYVDRNRVRAWRNPSGDGDRVDRDEATVQQLKKKILEMAKRYSGDVNLAGLCEVDANNLAKAAHANPAIP